MRVKRREESSEGCVEVTVEDWADEEESREHFEERLVRMVGRLTLLECLEPSEDDYDGERDR